MDTNEKRVFAFSTETRIYKVSKGEISSQDMVELTTTFLNDGPRFGKSLVEALGVIQERAVIKELI